MPPTPFRSFSPEHFLETPSWARLADILGATGGCYGLYGPRGSGKTWLIRRAIAMAEQEGGMGLWFPCPGGYGASEFLAALSGALAKEVETRFRRDSVWLRLRRWLQFILAAAVCVPVAIAVGAYLIRGVAGGKAPHGSLISVYPAAVWLVVGAAAGVLLILLGVRAARDFRPSERLIREAAAVREQIRYSATMRLGSELQLGRTAPVGGTWRRTRERSLDERPVTVISLVYDFRNLAASITQILPGLLVIGIDELDKIAEPDVVRALLREIKGIFDMTGVLFLVSVSEEAAAALELGPLLPEGRNEFNSSFFTVLELPPLSPPQAAALLAARGKGGDRRLAQVLCVLGEGNWREIVRLAEHATPPSGDAPGGYLSNLIMAVCEAETSALLREITRAGEAEPLADEAKLGAWNAFGADAFATEGDFTQASRVAMHKYWQPAWHAAAAWEAFHGPWRRLLIRLFVASRLIATQARFTDSTDAAQTDAIMIDLRNVVIMAGRSPGVAKSMLAERFGADLGEPYRLAGRASG